MLAPWKKNYDKHSILKSSGIALLTKVRLIKAMVFPVAMYGCESWTIKKAECWRIDALVLWCWRKLLRVPWTARRSNQSVKGNTTWILIGKTDAEAQPPILWLPDMKSWLTGQDPDAGKDWRQEEKGTTEEEMVGQHPWLNGAWFEQTLGDGEGQGSLTFLQSIESLKTQQDWATEQQQNYGCCKWKTIAKMTLGFSFNRVFPRRCNRA